jgi:hypothetical protein
MVIKKRFIAGAVCPRCSSMDTIYVYQQNNKDVRACADCDFEEQAQFDAQAEELPTRVNQTVDETVVEIQKIKIIDDT